MQTPESIDQSIDEHIEQRIDDLEIKASFSDELLEQLNAIVARQQMEIAALIREVQHLREQIPDKETRNTVQLQEHPPHY